VLWGWRSVCTSKEDEEGGIQMSVYKITLGGFIDVWHCSGCHEEKDDWDEANECCPKKVNA